MIEEEEKYNSVKKSNMTKSTANFANYESVKNISSDLQRQDEQNLKILKFIDEKLKVKKNIGLEELMDSEIKNSAQFKQFFTKELEDIIEMTDNDAVIVSIITLWLTFELNFLKSYFDDST